MATHSETVANSMEDIHRVIREARRNYGMNRSTTRTTQPMEIQRFVSEVDRLSTVLKSVAYSYEKLANETIEDPFSTAYEDVMLQLESVRKALAKSEECVKPYRNAR